MVDWKKQKSFQPLDGFKEFFSPLSRISNHREDTVMLRRTHLIFIFVQIVLFAGACSFQEPAPKAKYSIPTDFPNWKVEQLDPYDYLFSRDQKSLMIKSRCDRHESHDLKGLRRDILSGLETPEIIEETEITMSDRKALKSTVKAKVDGVPVKLTMINFQKDFCQFDFISIDANEILTDIIKGFRFP